MSAVPNTDIMSGKNPLTRLEMIKIYVAPSTKNSGLPAEDSVMIDLLGRGWKVPTAGYYSLCDFVYGAEEKSMTFRCALEESQNCPSKESGEAYSAFQNNFPEFKVLFDGNLVIVPNELFGISRAMAENFGISPFICKEVLKWLIGLGHTQAVVVERVKIFHTFEITRIVRAARHVRRLQQKKHGVAPSFDNCDQVAAALRASREEYMERSKNPS